jgi:UDP-N-acetylmuramate--alanine ligase
MPKLETGMHIHLVGIGGVGLSAIARVLIQRGFKVSGSDKATNALTDALARDGAMIYEGHRAEQINGADAIIVTSAAQSDNAEVVAARAAGIPVYKRSEIIMDVINAGLNKPPFLIAVAGTHGKTTTTGMIAHVLIELGLKPGYIIGGVLGTTGTNADAGAGNMFVIEADEYDNMFHGLKPNIAVVTNVEWDHPDFFKTPEDMTAAFEQFVDQLATPGLLVACLEDEGAARLYERQRDKGRSASGYRKIIPPPRLVIPGGHNELNASGVVMTIRVAMQHFDFAAPEQPMPRVSLALSHFKGMARRFELMGVVGEIAVINDYAHHPTAIRATIEAARSAYPAQEIWAVWQPHTYSRTKALWDDYVKAFQYADHVLVTDIYAAREQLVDDVSAARIVADMAKVHKAARHSGTLENTADILIREVDAPAVILIMSAGDAPKIGEIFLNMRSDHE